MKPDYKIPEKPEVGDERGGHEMNIYFFAGHGEVEATLECGTNVRLERIEFERYRIIRILGEDGRSTE